MPDLLRRRGYGQGESSITMMKSVRPTSPSTDVDIAETADAEWREVYLGAITENRRLVNAKILDSVPRPCAYFSCRRAGQVISTALCVADDGLAVVECMATRQQARRLGGAIAVLRSIEAWAAMQNAKALALQVVADNRAAMALYAGFGFTAVATNRFWLRD